MKFKNKLGSSLTITIYVFDEQTRKITDNIKLSEKFVRNFISKILRDFKKGVELRMLPGMDKYNSIELSDQSNNTRILQFYILLNWIINFTCKFIIYSL